MGRGGGVPIVYGWPVSPYTEKVVSYLRHCQVTHRCVAPTARQLRGKIRRAVGRTIMPTVELATGQWIQDSSDIIEYFEARRARPRVQPSAPAQRLTSALLEFYADEWMPMMIMHTRWNVAENRAFARAQFAALGLPWCPGVLGRRLISPIVEKMAGYREVLGVTGETIPGVERSLSALLDALEVQLEITPFLLGSRACVGDFALHGSLYAHVYRDPGTSSWFDSRPRVVAWMQRLREPAAAEGAFLPQDEVPGPVRSILGGAFGEQWPFACQIVEGINALAAQDPRPALPRGLGWAPITVGGVSGRRKMATEAQWKIQRVLDVFAAEDVQHSERVHQLLEETGGAVLRTIEIEAPVVRRSGRATFRDQTNREVPSAPAASGSG